MAEESSILSGKEPECLLLNILRLLPFLSISLKECPQMRAKQERKREQLSGDIGAS